ncbi:hypothetical protein ACTZWW_07300 [Salinarimonas sp. NSM]
MKEIEKIDVRRAGAWLSGEVEIRVPKTWLAAGAVALGVLVLLAFD